MFITDTVDLVIIAAAFMTVEELRADAVRYGAEALALHNAGKFAKASRTQRVMSAILAEVRCRPSAA